ncbi:MAG TPA: hypothetical protein K8W01_00455 [Methylorubrum populi]|uniref:Uncharacterized protein n=1 Tax=Methylorubrum populi TaxID=223967 RepID=A0A921JDN0_9HYPH|nr:hypothetical protein [Methylorubrum populi]
MPADQLSLYIDLHKGQKADLEAAARASLAFAEAVREIAEFLDPFVDVQLELLDTSEGSLFVNARVKLVAFAAEHQKTLWALSLVSAGWIGGQVAEFGSHKVLSKGWESLFGAEASNLSDEDKQDIAERAAKAVEAKAGERSSRQVIAELAQDPAVKGVGISKTSKRRPTDILPRSQFAEKMNNPASDEIIVPRRITTEVQKVVLISPVLVQGKRRWKFRIGKKEFGAPILDTKFVDAVLTGKYPIVMKSDVVMTVELETKEELRDGKWVPTERSVLKVIGTPRRNEGRQLSFSLDSQ